MSEADVTIHFAARSRNGTSPHKCGAFIGRRSAVKHDVTCTDCLAQLGRANSHVPPIMNDNSDGIFLFTDRHHGAGFTMEVVPQLSGNVEIAIEDKDGAGHMFTLSHLDRADLLRALLHEFHYSPERGGPNGID